MNTKQIRQNISDLARGAYHSTVGMFIDGVDGMITLGYTLGPEADDVKAHRDKVPRTRAGLVGMVIGATIDVAAAAGIIYSMAGELIR